MFSKILAATTPSQPGAGLSLTAAGMNNAKDVVAPYIFNMTSDIQIPEVDFDGGWLKNLHIDIPQPALSDIAFSTDVANQGVELKAQGVTATVNSDFSYKYIITCTGQIAIDIKKLDVDLELDFLTQPSTPSWELAPKLAVQKTDITVNPADIDVKLTGGLVAKIASVFIPFVKNSLVPTLIQTVET